MTVDDSGGVGAVVAPPEGVARFQPPLDAVSEPFWDGTRRCRLVLPWCSACDRAFFFPRVFCPHCGGDAIAWREASGRGEIYAVTVEHRPQNPTMTAMAPYAVALVELDEGVRMLTNVVDTDPASLRVGDRVAVAWEPLDDGRHLPLFQPDPAD